MITWTEAQRIANVAAAQAHYDLGVDTGTCRVDVAAAIARAEVLLFWRPLPGLFGAYIHEPGSQPGIIVNSRLTPAVRNYTAAHELGHHYFGHTSCIDDESTVQADDAADEYGIRGARSTRRGWPDEEKLAESFAAWFLMPRQAGLAGLRVLGIEHLRAEHDVYRLSLLLGVPYRSLVRHLPNIRLASANRARTWTSIAPSRIKAQLDRHVLPPSSRRGAVWVVDREWDGELIGVYPGDRIVVEAGTYDLLATAAGLERVTPRSTPAGGPPVLECRPDGSPTVDIQLADEDGNPVWGLKVQRARTPGGVDENWTSRRERLDEQR
jgi:hypothetical protein